MARSGPFDVLAFLVAFVSLTLVMVACGGPSKQEIIAARAARYDMDAVTVYRAAYDATEKLYPVLEGSEKTQTIMTGWHQYRFSASTGYARYGTVTSKHYFIRFDITISGPRPWQVHIIGHAAEKTDTEALSLLPTEVEPGWVQERVDQLYRRIHERLEQYASR